jgi:methylated-DNA-protein-cysteine methyltransferase related protein
MPPKHKLHRTAPPQGDQAAAAICAIIRRIPKGWVATYGQVAATAGLSRRARLVGYVLQNLDPATKIPWHRVVNAKGEVSYSFSSNGSDALMCPVKPTASGTGLMKAAGQRSRQSATIASIHGGRYDGAAARLALGCARWVSLSPAVMRRSPRSHGDPRRFRTADLRNVSHWA